MSNLLTIKQLSVELQKKTILSDLELSLNAGDILGLVGPSGCGKTTLLNTIAGFIEQSQGQISLGDTLTITPEHQVAPEHRKVGMIFQDYALFPHLTVAKNICFGIDKLAINKQQARLTQLLELLALTGLDQRYPHQLSGGQQQRVAIARALAPQPQLLLLDEPFSNIDARLRNELMLEMRQLLKQLNMTAIFVTHNKDEVFTFADKIAVMHHGRILQTGSPIDVCQSPRTWEVADFLQLGSWVPVAIKQHSNERTEYTTLLNTFSSDLPVKSLSEPMSLLLTNKNVELMDGASNCKVEHVSITEHGFHYRLRSLERHSALTFSSLSFYSEESFKVSQELCINIIPHQPIVFQKTSTSR